MSNSAKDTREGVMDALGNVAKGAEEFAKEVVTEVRLSRHPQHARPFFDRFRLFLASKKLLQAPKSYVAATPRGKRERAKNKSLHNLKYPSFGIGFFYVHLRTDMSIRPIEYVACSCRAA